MVTFDDWLDFIVRKARRHTGEDIVLTERERRMPLVFLWPRVIHYLRHKDRRAMTPAFAVFLAVLGRRRPLHGRVRGRGAGAGTRTRTARARSS